MTSNTTKPDAVQPEAAARLFEDWFDPIESGLRERVRGFIEEMIRSELDAVLARPRYARQRTGAENASTPTGLPGHRHGSRTRTLMGTFGPTEITVPRARLAHADGKTTEWRSQGLRAYQRRTLAADALIASTYLSGTNTRRVRRALAALFRGAVSKDTVSPVWQGEERLGHPECSSARRTMRVAGSSTLLCQHSIERHHWRSPQDNPQAIDDAEPER